MPPSLSILKTLAVRTMYAVVCGLALAGTAAAAQPAAPACPPTAEARLTPQLLEQARRRPVDRGYLWRIVKDGRTSWLYGTLHLGRAA